MIIKIENRKAKAQGFELQWGYTIFDGWYILNKHSRLIGPYKTYEEAEEAEKEGDIMQMLNEMAFQRSCYQYLLRKFYDES